MKNAIASLIGIALKFYVALVSVIILTILILLIKESGISFHLLIFS